MSATRRRRYSPQPGEERVVQPPTAPGPAPDPGGAGPAPAEGPRHVKECPFCRREIPEVALECPLCRRRVAGAGRPEDFQRRLLAQELALRRALRDGKLAGLPRGLLAGLRLRTILTGAAALVGLAGGLAAGLMPEQAGLTASAVPVGLLALMFFAYFLVSDLLWLSASRRRDPASAIKAFLRAMKIGRYREACDCVLPGDRNARVRGRRAVREMGIPAARSAFQDPAGFRAYWEPVFATPDVTASISQPRVFGEQGDFATVAIGITLKRRASGAGGGLIGAAVRAAMAGSIALSMRKLVRRVDGRWYLVNGEMDSPEDGAMEEFAALAAAPDAQLVELSRAPAPAAGAPAEA